MVELLLLALILVQAARLTWTLVTPVDPFGAWKGSAAASAPVSAAILDEFDPFFRLVGSGGPATVTALDLRLFGVREDRATGGGSAIIALPDGTQRSFGIGETLLPGVILREVGFDSVTIDRSGLPERIFLDQSSAAPPPADPGADAGANMPPVDVSAPAAAAEDGDGTPLRFQPRMTNGRLDGVMVSPGADGGRLFRAAGFAPGDVIVSVGGRRIASLEQARALARASGGEVSVVVDRAGRAVPLRVRIDR